MYPLAMSSSRRSLDLVATATLERRRDLEARVRDVHDRYNRVRQSLDTILGKATSVLQLGIEPLLERSRLASHHMQLTSTAYFLEDLDFYCCKYIEETWPDDSPDPPTALATLQAIEERQNTVIGQEAPPAWRGIESAPIYSDNGSAAGLQRARSGQGDCQRTLQSHRDSNQQRTVDRRSWREPCSGRESEGRCSADPVQGSVNLRQDTPPNLLDALSEPAACAPPLVPVGARKKKRENELLIDFSSNSSLNQTSNSSPHVGSGDRSQEREAAPRPAPPAVPADASPPPVGVLLPISDDPREGLDAEEAAQRLQDVTLTDDEADAALTQPQSLLELDQSYACIVTHVVSPSSFYVITVAFAVLQEQNRAMSEYYSQRHTDVRGALPSMQYCALHDEDEWFRCMIVDKQESSVDVYFMDYGSMSEGVPLDGVRPLAPRFCSEPPYARQCHLAGVEAPGGAWSEEAIELLMNIHCSNATVRVDDNSSESLGVRLRLQSGRYLHEVLLERGLAVTNATCSLQPSASRSPAEGDAAEHPGAWEIGAGPEYTDALEAVQGYSNRDEADICKHYKGPPEITCFKGRNCKKRHILMNPEGWTLDRQEVAEYPASLALPGAGSRLTVQVAHVENYRHFYVHLLDCGREKNDTGLSSLFPASLQQLVTEMNSAGARRSLQPLRSPPAVGELLAAVYPDGKWYRAQTLETDQERNLIMVRYVDFGNRCWVASDTVRQLEPRFLQLPFQAVQCQLADVALHTSMTDAVTAATAALRDLVDQKRFDATVVSLVSAELLLVELTDGGFSVAETLASQHHRWFAWKPSPRPTAPAPARVTHLPG